MAQVDLKAVADARMALSELEARDQALTVDLRDAITTRASLTRSGASPEEIAEANARFAQLNTDRQTLRAEVHVGHETLHQRREELLQNRSEDDLVATLAGSYPVALLPVRLETRYFDNARELRIRIYPDQVHLDQHDRALTNDEKAAADWYWKQRPPGSDQAAGKAAFGRLVLRFGAQRSAWIVEAGRNGNVPETRASRWARASAATALPDRWLVVGYTAGQEQFRKWGKIVPNRVTVGLTPDPVAIDTSATPVPTDLPLSEDLKWTADYATAEAQGMAITVTQGNLHPDQPALASGVDRLVVVGVDWTLTAEQGSAAMHQLLEGHLYADGLSVVPQGTPTNNTATSTSGKDSVNAAALDPLEFERVAASTPTSLGLARLLGVPADSPALRRIPGGACSEQETAQRLLSALWSSTIGCYLSQMLDPLIDAQTQASVRNHAVAYLRANGFGPTLRLGKQPYGILPVLPRKGFQGTDAFETQLANTLESVRQPWSLAMDRVPRVSAGPGRDDASGTLDSRMLRILQQAPVASALRFRRVLSATTAVNASSPFEVAEVQQRLMALLVAHFGWTRRPYIANLETEPEHYPLPVPFVQAAIGPNLLSPNYIDAIATAMQRPSVRGVLEQRLTELQDGDTLLQAFLALGAVQAIDAATLAVLARQFHADQPKTQALEAGYFPVAEAIHILNRDATPTGTAVVSSPWEAARVVIPKIHTELPVADLFSLALSDPTIRDRLPDVGAVELIQRFVDDLGFLATRNADELDWAFRGVLDCMSYRLDAWISSLANRRLAEVRARPESASGTYIGGYGWLEDLRPDPQGSDSLGYVFAPSLPHAAAAAILRSGDLARSEGGPTVLDVDLSSARVAPALRVLEGVGRGQSLAALLGYRLERALREQDPRLARFIQPIRKVAPLRPLRTESTPPAGPAETISARDVCDGVSLLDRWRADRGQLLADIGAAATPPAPDLQEIADVGGELDRLADLMDSVSDVLVSESVYQTVLGNPERAGAALGVLDRQIRPIQPQVVDTPRSAHVYTQRAAVMTLERLPAPAAGSAATDPVLVSWTPFSNDARAKAEPRINAWVARLLGRPRRYQFTADVVTKAEDGTETREPLAPIGLRSLGLSPLMLVAAATGGSQGQPTELHQRLVRAFLAGRPALSEDTVLELKADAASSEPRAIGLGGLETFLGLIQKLLGGARQLDTRDFLAPSTTPVADIDVADLATRSEELLERMKKASRPLAKALSADSVEPEVVFRALNTLSDAGFLGALPRLIDVAGLAHDSEPVMRLLDQARDANAALAGAFSRIAALDDSWTKREDVAAGKATPPLAAVEYHTACIRELLGKDFLVVTPFAIKNADELSASLSDQASLTLNDPLAVTNWLQRLALVRPPLDRLASVITAADLLESLPNDTGLRVAQLPHAPKSPWLALFKKGGRPSAHLALVLQCFSPLTTKQRWAGFMCDEWSEAIPSAEETVAVTFHYDAPGARPPQAIVVAVPATLAVHTWTTAALLDVVNEALDLAKLRMIGPQDLDLHGLLLPAVYLPDAFNRHVPGVNLTQLKIWDPAETVVTRKNVVWTSQ